MTAADVLVLDTHALVWFLTADHRLGPAARAALTDERIEVVIPALVLAEVSSLSAKGRTPVDLARVLRHVHQTDNTRIASFDETTARLLPADLDIHDGIIVATGLALLATGVSVALVTRDAKITASGLVDVVWWMWFGEAMPGRPPPEHRDLHRLPQRRAQPPLPAGRSLDSGARPVPGEAVTAAARAPARQARPRRAAAASCTRPLLTRPLALDYTRVTLSQGRSTVPEGGSGERAAPCGCGRRRLLFTM
jgi:PIN domain nuclease of toxin-antitoxin system